MIFFDATIFCLTIGRTIFFIRLSPEMRGTFSLPMLIMRDGKKILICAVLLNSRLNALFRKPVLLVSTLFRR